MSLRITQELLDDSFVDLRQMLQDDLDGKPRRQLTPQERKANRLAEIEAAIAQLEYEREELTRG